MSNSCKASGERGGELNFPSDESSSSLLSESVLSSILALIALMSLPRCKTDGQKTTLALKLPSSIDEGPLISSHSSGWFAWYCIGKVKLWSR